LKWHEVGGNEKQQSVACLKWVNENIIIKILLSEGTVITWNEQILRYQFSATNPYEYVFIKPTEKNDASINFVKVTNVVNNVKFPKGQFCFTLCKIMLLFKVKKFFKSYSFKFYSTVNLFSILKMSVCEKKNDIWLPIKLVN